VAAAGFLSSPRRRRRLLKGGSALVVLGTLAFVGIHWSNTGHSENLPVSNKAAVIVPEPVLHKEVLSGARRVAAGYTVQRFLFEGVLGKNRGDTWDIVSPSFRQGFTRAQWQHGVTPIVPYPVGSYRAVVSEAYTDRVEMEVRTYPKAHSGQREQTFSLELTQTGKGAGAHWVVNYWLPKATLNPAPAGGANLDPPSNKAVLGPVWLVLPFGLLGGAVLVLAGFGARGWYRGVRARRAYERQRLAG
jgi:hypothetical protein